MKKEWILIPVACLSLAICGLAEAQSSSRLRASGKSPRIDMGKQIGRSVNMGQATRGAATLRGAASTRGTMSLQRPSVPAGARLDRGRQPNLGLNRGVQGDLSGNALGGLLGQYLNGNGYGYNHRYDPFEGEKAHAKAYRDAAIANAVVNVIGILATANQPRVAEVCPPAGVVTTPAAPCGRVERQRVLVQEGRTEEYQVWIPEHTIPETGEVVVGHHETRRRDVPPVYEEREIWIPAR